MHFRHWQEVRESGLYRWLSDEGLVFLREMNVGKGAEHKPAKRPKVRVRRAFYGVCNNRIISTTTAYGQKAQMFG